MVIIIFITVGGGNSSFCDLISINLSSKGACHGTDDVRVSENKRGFFWRVRGVKPSRYLSPLAQRIHQCERTGAESPTVGPSWR